MTVTTTAQLVAEAQRTGVALLAFNVITLEHAQGILEGATRSGQPVILQISENAARYHPGGPRPLLVACQAVIEQSPARSSIHLDHIRDRELLAYASTDCGVSSVMFDASELDDDDNVDLTRRVTTNLHDRGIWVEAELGAIGGKGGAHQPGIRTDPTEAARYVNNTDVDALAVAVGSSHAMTQQTAQLDLDLIRHIAAATPVPLVLHGSSGVPARDLRLAAQAGIVKINVGTALNVAFTNAIRDTLTQQSGTDPRSYLGAARRAIADTVENLVRQVTDAAPHTPRHTDPPGRDKPRPHPKGLSPATSA